MRLRDETPLDPDVAASLDAIDAVLAGDPVDPRHAGLAELALMLAAERPEIDGAFATLLDEGVQRRFIAPRRARPARARRWLWAPAAGLATAAVVVIAVLSSSSPRPTLPARSAVHAAVASGANVPAPAKVPAGTPSSERAAVSTAVAGAATGAIPTSPPFLAPPANGRKLIQSAQLALSTTSSHVEAVSQEVFDVVGTEHGIVNNSTVTAAGGPGGYAQFQLSIPSATLPQAMAALSTLRYAQVSSRTDNTRDVNDQYQSDVRKLADARALRTSLLKQLAGATTQAQIESLTAQIHDAEASISSDEATLRSLGRQIGYSQVTLTINGGPVPVTSHGAGGGSGFTLGKAAHDAGRVLTVAAGVALIALAVLVPAGLLAAAVWWVLLAVRRRRREQALDLA